MFSLESSQQRRNESAVGSYFHRCSDEMRQAFRRFHRLSFLIFRQLQSRRLHNQLSVYLFLPSPNLYVHIIFTGISLSVWMYVSLRLRLLLLLPSPTFSSIQYRCQWYSASYFPHRSYLLLLFARRVLLGEDVARCRAVAA